MVSATLTQCPPATEAELIAMWGGDPAWHIIPCFADDWDDVEAAKDLLRRVFGEDDVEFAIRGHAAGVELLQWYVSRDVFGQWLVDMFARRPPESVLVLGRVIV